MNNIVGTIKDTKSYTNEQISLLYGGYHMLPYGRDKINRIASQLKNDFGFKKAVPAHCTGPLAFKILKDVYSENFVFAGSGEAINFEN